MIKEVREKFNKEFTEEKYSNFLNDVWQVTNGEVDFRINETPLFINSDLTESLIEASESIASQLQTLEFKKASLNAVPEKYNIPNENDHPLFLQVDFAIAENENGELIPQLIELQGFPSLYAFQTFLANKVKEHFHIDNSLDNYFNNYNDEKYIELFGKAVLNNKEKENVILLEINPDKQKTRIDFYLTKKYLGIETVCISKIIQRGNKLFYKKNNVEIPIERIYNRVIFDELENKNVKYDFNFKDDLQVEWAGHPNWFFRISKYSLPIIKSKFAPLCFFLNELKEYPDDLENYVLKPLYSFAGSGVIVDVTKENLEAIKDKQNYILQKKVTYAPLIKTPDEFAKAEIRMMFLWLDRPILVNNLLRVSKGKMMGVDFNKNKTWIGANIAFHR
ncbi:MAG: hypothetical protein A2068_12955 [Ignavibacteria bacterium GWB2_35_6b]|nr:MAG: hypothetical protein A2068_12955 [Ignavibacteria bacterium GWB2_35_6b]